MMGHDIEAIFHAARTRGPSERIAFLHSACGDDPDTLALVESLLTSYDAAPDFLETPAAEWIVGTGREYDRSIQVGARIGNYQIVRVIAMGGMGIVYEARQAAPQRTVALKLLRRGFRSPAAIRRFQRESEVLGRLRHVGIAQILEAGVQREEQESLPYFAMEFLLDALPLTTFANARSLDAEQRIELLCRVCEAVEYCHRQGIIHRDLKPANILVTPEGQPKVIDFGVARTHESVQSDPSWHTTGAPMIGSLPYMSPEQVGGDPTRVDGQSDVYALGVVAYELLSGRLPLDVATLPPIETARIIREEDPTRLGEIERRFRGDLETIIATALAKEKEQRYPTAAALAADLGHYLRHEPIQARPTAVWKHLGKFARRNRALVGGAAVAFIGLIIGGLAATWQALAAITARDRAQQALAESQTVRGFVQSILQHANPKAHGRNFSVREALDSAAIRIDAELAENPRARAAIHRTVAESYWAIGELDTAEGHFQKSLALLRSASPPDTGELHRTTAQLVRMYLFGARFDGAVELLTGMESAFAPNLAPDHPYRADVYELQGQLAYARGEWSAAAQFSRRCLAARRSVNGRQSVPAAEALIHLGSALESVNISESIACAREALSIRKSVQGETHVDTLWEMKELAYFLGRRGGLEDLGEEEGLLRAALAGYVMTTGEKSLEAATVESVLGTNLHRQGRNEEARPALFRALEIKRELLGDEHHETAQTMHSIGGFLIQVGRPEEAVPILEKAVEVRKARLGETHPDTVRSNERLQQALDRSRELTDNSVGKTEQSDAGVPNPDGAAFAPKH